MDRKEITKLNSRMIRNVFLNVELLLNDGITEISEYDIQAFIFMFYRRALTNCEFEADRERFGKVDCAIHAENVPNLFYELKTYYKSNEQPNQSDFDHDIEKLGRRKAEWPDARTFLILAGLKRKFSPESLAEFPWLNDRIQDHDLHHIFYEFAESKKQIKLRPSAMEKQGVGIVLAFEILAE